MIEQNNSLWRASAANEPLLTPLQTSIEVDVAVVGAGFTGLSTALHLAERGLKVAIVETQCIGFGGSGRNVGLVNAGLWLEPEQVEKQLGVAPAQRLYHTLAQAPDLVFSLIEKYAIECEATRQGTLHAAVGKAGWQQLQRRWQQLDRRQAPVQLLNQSAARERIGSSYFTGALFDPRAGTIQPLAYAHGLASAALSLGVDIYTETPVLSIAAVGGAWSLACPQGHTVTAPRVVMATNAYSGPLLPELKQAFVPIQYSQFASQPLSAQQLASVLPNKEGMWDTCTVMSSMRLDQSGRLIFGGMGGLGQGRSLAQWASGRMAHLYPQLGTLEWQYAWSGKIAFSDDHLPHCHRLAQGLYSLIGYSGRGIGPGTMMGKALAHHLLGDADALPIEITPVDSVRFRGVKQAFYEVGAQVHHMGQRIISL